MYDIHLITVRVSLYLILKVMDVIDKVTNLLERLHDRISPDNIPEFLKEDYTVIQISGRPRK